MNRADSKPKFFADCMLGKLAKWMRVMGYDTLYSSDLNDAELVQIARAEGRTVLTRDRQMIKRKNASFLFIESEYLEEQLKQIIQELELELDDAPFTRCAICNTPLVEVNKEEVEDSVPPYVFSTQEKFAKCPICNHYYWRGTHWERMREMLDKIKGEL